MKVNIETERLFLREVRIEDVQGFFELDSDPEVHRYLGNNPVNSIEQSQKMVEGVIKQYEDLGIGRLAIVEKQTGEFVGWSGLKYETRLREGVRYYDLGYRLKRKFWGRGIAKETAIASLQYGFVERNLDKICAAAHVDNIASNKILRGVGLKFVDTFMSDEDLCNWYELEKSQWEQE